MDNKTIWLAALGELELTLSKANFTTWFKNTFISSYENGKIIISVPNTFTKSWLEKKYHDAIMRALRSATLNGVREIQYRVEIKNFSNTNVYNNIEPSREIHSDQDNFDIAIPQTGEVKNVANSETGLNTQKNFSTFVVGKTNELAHAAAQAVAGKPGEVYNPLYIYGGPGLGKTHLLHAIGHHILQQNSKAKILYCSTERFINDYIKLVRTGRANELKNTYRTVDVLLLDDIQFMANKEGTQEEFFHTFNTLYDGNKQLVITSDREPREIEGMEKRLSTRLGMGLVADVSSPDFETRVAILESKTKEKNIFIGSDILRYVAGTVHDNVRELESVLMKIISYHHFKNTPFTLPSVQSIIQSYVPSSPKRRITPKRLIEVVVGYFDLTINDIIGKSREQRLAFPRQIAMYLLRQEIKCSFPAIGNHLGNRDHTTVMHACTKITELLKNNQQLKNDISLIREKVYATESE